MVMAPQNGNYPPVEHGMIPAVGILPYLLSPTAQMRLASFLDNLTADGIVTLDGDKIVGSLVFK